MTAISFADPRWRGLTPGEMRVAMVLSARRPASTPIEMLLEAYDFETARTEGALHRAIERLDDIFAQIDLTIVRHRRAYTMKVRPKATPSPAPTRPPARPRLRPVRREAVVHDERAAQAPAAAPSPSPGADDILALAARGFRPSQIAALTRKPYAAVEAALSGAVR